MKQGLSFCAVLLMVFGLVACHTVQGVGKDIEAGGKAIQRATR